MVMKHPVFKKMSPNGKITMFLTKREYITTATDIDHIEGVIRIDPSYVRHRCVFVALKAVIRYAVNENGDCKMGKCNYFSTDAIYPPEEEVIISEVQKNLVKKLGGYSFPFTLDFPKVCSPSSIFQEGYKDEGPLLFVNYSVITWTGEHEMDKEQESMIEISVRLIQELPQTVYNSPIPKKEVSRSFFSCAGSVTVEVTLPYLVHKVGDDIIAKVSVTNATTVDIKTLKARIIQLSDLPVFNATKIRDRVTCKVDEPWLVLPGHSSTRSITLRAIPPLNPDHGEVFLEGDGAGTSNGNLAPTTILPIGINKEDVWGSVINYLVRIKVVMGIIYGEVTADLPIIIARKPDQSAFSTT